MLTRDVPMTRTLMTGPLAAALTAVKEAAAATAEKGSTTMTKGESALSKSPGGPGFGGGGNSNGNATGGGGDGGGATSGGTLSRQSPGAKSFKIQDSGLRRVATKLTRKVRSGTSSKKAVKESAAEAAVAAAVAEATNGEEISVMNNYFGIGLDAKVAMDFDTFRNENPEKCRSRMKNQMWYGTISPAFRYFGDALVRNAAPLPCRIRGG